MTRIPGTDLETLELPAEPPGDDDPCWCPSGQPFRKCHKNRETQIPESKWAVLRKMRSLNSAAYCGHPAASPQECRGQIVKAHTVQKSRVLSEICVDGHVYGLRPGAVPDGDGIFHFEPVGVNVASTFTGFCRRHDTELFKPLEAKPFIASKEQLFLLAYRALSKEVYAKRFALRMQPILRMRDVGRSVLEQVQIQRYLYVHEQQLRLSLRDLEANLKDYDEIYRVQDFNRVSAFVVFANQPLDFAASGGWSPEFDFAGRSLQDLASSSRLDFMTFSALPFSDGGVIAFVWDSMRGDSCVQFARSLDALVDADMPDALVRLTFEHFENKFFDPRWWNSLDRSARDLLERRFAIAASSRSRLAGCLVDDGLRTARWKIIGREWL